MTSSRNPSLLLRIALLSLAGLAGASTASSAEVFVSLTGNDRDGDGSLDKPYASIPYALDLSSPGDIITLRGGVYPTTAILRVRKDNLTIQGYPGEQVTIAAPITNSSHHTCIYFDNPGGTLRNLEITGGYFYAVKLDKGGALIENCKIHDTGADCIKIIPGSDDVTIRNNEIYNSGKRESRNAEGIDNVNGDRMHVHDNYIHDISTNGLYPKGGAKNAVIERNRIVNCGGAGIAVGYHTDQEFFDADNTNFYESIDGIFRNNLIINTQGAGIGLWGAVRAKIYNNTLINVAESFHGGLYFEGTPNWDIVANRPVPGVDPTVENNIVVLSAATNRPMIVVRNHSLSGTVTLNHNRYYKTGGEATFRDERGGTSITNLSNWRGRIPSDSDSSEGNPQLDAANDYRPMPGSPVVNAGVIVSDVTEDFYKTPRSGAYDLGAIELPEAPSCSDLPRGDVNGDGIVNIGDAAVTLRIAVQLVTPANECVAKAADVDCSGQVGIADTLLILRRIVYNEDFAACSQAP
jgi:hypothetical protein